MPPECKVCKLWQALHRTRQSSGTGGGPRPPGQPGGQHPAHMQQGYRHPAPGMGGRGGGPGGRGMGPGSVLSPGRGGSSSQQEQLRQKLRQLDPAQVKKMLLAHVMRSRLNPNLFSRNLTSTLPKARRCSLPTQCEP